MEIAWTGHAGYRQKEWERTKGITRQDVETVVAFPEQIVPGDLDALVAQSRFRGGLLRVPFTEAGGTRKILTVYWTSKVERYWSQGPVSERGER